MVALAVMGLGSISRLVESHMTILAALSLPHRIVATNEEETSESPRRPAGSLGKDIHVGRLFLIRGLILLAATALLVPLTGLIRHRIGLAGLVALLRLIRLILLCHVSSPDYQRRLFMRVQRRLINTSD
jgi:hypothetical protein